MVAIGAVASMAATVALCAVVMLMLAGSMVMSTPPPSDHRVFR